MPFVIAGIAATGALSWLTHETGEAVEQTGNTALKLAAAAAIGVGAYYVYKRGL